MRPLLRLIFVNLLGNLLRVLALPLRRRPRWVRLVLDEPLPARPPHTRFFRRAPSLASLTRSCDDLIADPQVAGVIVDLHDTGGGWAHAQSLRDLLGRLAAAGKQVVAHLSSPSLRDYFVATAATKIGLDESGPVGLAGLSAEVLFFGKALDQAGVLAETEYRGPYKSMGEVFTRSDMSPAHREALDAILDGVQETLAAAVAAGRGVARERAAELLAGGPYAPAEALRLGLVDKVLYADEVPAWAGAPIKPANARAYRRARRLRFAWKPLFGGPRLAVVPLHGMIVGGEGGGRSLGAKAAARTLAALREDRGVAAAVLHIDSRGGSAAASDLIWREVTRLAKAKPVVAYMHDVAASGGYYIACGATRIVAQPTTLTGSIGVVAGKLSFGDLLERAGITAVTLRRGDAATMLSPLHGFSEEERRRLATEVDSLYQQFVGKVAAGRKLDAAAAEERARGRVWLGRDAKERSLVDELGDAEAAVRAARALVGPAGARCRVVEAAVQPRHRSLLSRVLAVEPLLEEAALLLRERVVALAPRLDVR
jgi:protease IV